MSHHKQLRGVFIAGGSTARGCKFPVLPFNHHNYIIFHGFSGNITSTYAIVDYSWTDKWASSGLRDLRHRSSPAGPLGSTFAIQIVHSPFARLPFALRPSLAPLRHQAGSWPSFSSKLGVFTWRPSLQSLRTMAIAG